MEKKHDIVKRHGNAHNFAVLFNPSIQDKCAMDIERSLYGTAPTLRQLSATYTQDQNVMWIMAHLEDLNKFCGVKSKMEVSQMKQVASIILIEYPYLKASEVLLFFFRFKAGLHGQLYGSVDPLMITNALVDFMKWRARERSKIDDLKKQEERKRVFEESRKNAITREEFERKHKTKMLLEEKQFENWEEK